MAAISWRAAAVIFPAVRNSGRSILITTRLPCVRMTTPSNPSRSMHWLSSLAGQAIETLSRQHLERDQRPPGHPYALLVAEGIGRDHGEPSAFQEHEIIGDNPLQHTAVPK